MHQFHTTDKSSFEAFAFTFISLLKCTPKDASILHESFNLFLKLTVTTLYVLSCVSSYLQH